MLNWDILTNFICSSIVYYKYWIIRLINRSFILWICLVASIIVDVPIFLAFSGWLTENLMSFDYNFQILLSILEILISQIYVFSFIQRINLKYVTDFLKLFILLLNFLSKICSFYMCTVLLISGIFFRLWDPDYIIKYGMIESFWLKINILIITPICR